MSRSFQAFCVATLAFAALAAPAGAVEQTTTRERTEVRYADLNTNTREGAAALLSRLDAAARRICGYDMQERGFNALQQRICVDNAVAHAVTRADNPLVTQLYAERRTGFASH